MRKISFIKTIKVTAELPDNFFSEDGSIPAWALAQWIDNNECEYVEKDEDDGPEYSQWQQGAGIVQEVRIFPKNMEYCPDEAAETVIDQKQFADIMEDIYDAEACDECTGYGDDYDFEGNCNCMDCPHNRTSHSHYVDFGGKND